MTPAMMEATTEARVEETQQPRERDLPVTVFSWPGHTATSPHEDRRGNGAQ